MTMDIKEAITLENKAFRADNEISPPKMSLFGIPKGLGVLPAIMVVHRDDLRHSLEFLDDLIIWENIGKNK